MPFIPLIQKLIEESTVLFSQAIAHTQSGEISHYEILSRFMGNDICHIPLEFVKWLEDHKLANFLDRFVIAETLRFIAESGSKDRFAVNLTPDTINENGQFSKFLATQKALYGFTNLPLILEVTERAAVQETTAASSVLGFIRALGCPLAIDDFGSSDSNFNLASLDLLQPQYLKIDGCHTAQLPSHTAIADINAFCQIAHARGIQVILEQVEERHLEIVRSHTNVDFIQGYAIARPKILF